MNNPVNPINPADSTTQQGSQQVQSSKAPDAHTAEGLATAHTNQKEFSTDTRVSNTKELREKAPEVWKAILEGVAMQVIRRVKRFNERMIKEMKKMRRK